MRSTKSNKVTSYDMNDEAVSLIVDGRKVQSRFMLYSNHISYIVLVARSNTYTVALRVVEGDKKGCLGSETVEYRHESHGTGTGE
jgi:hypothetical protein